MDAARLIAATRDAVAQAREERAVIAAAWRAQEVVEAVSGHLARQGGLEVTGGARCVESGLRAGALNGVRDPAAALDGLLAVLAEAGGALAAVACATEDEAVYWQCIDAADATDDAVDRVRALLRRYKSADRD